MDRKSFITAKKPKEPEPIITNVYKGQRVLSGIVPYSGSWTNSEIIHLLRRTMFGAKKEDVDFFIGKTMDEVVDYLLDVPGIQPIPPLKNYNSSNVAGDPDATIQPGET